MITERGEDLEAAGRTRAEAEVERAIKSFGAEFVSKVRAKIRDLETERMEAELTVSRIDHLRVWMTYRRYNSNLEMRVKVVRLRNVRFASTFSQMVSSLDVVMYSVASVSVSLAPFIASSAVPNISPTISGYPQ